MGFVSRHLERELSLPKHRDEILEKVINDLSKDSDVLAIYLSGSLAKGNDDQYSDIDVHTIVKPKRKPDFIKHKRQRAKKWGNALFFEDSNPASSVIVTHYDCFVKVDSWYHSPEEVAPSIWLKGIKVIYDPTNLLNGVIEQSSKLNYETTEEEVVFWRGKVLAFIHETYRAVMRDERYYALSNLDRIRWFIAYGWYLEKGQCVDGTYGIWSKLEGERSQLNSRQLSLLENWDATRNPGDIMEAMVNMIPEFIRVNKCLSHLVEIEDNEAHLKKAIEMAY